MGNTARQCRLGLFQDSDFAGDLEDSKSTSGGTLCVFGSHTFVPTSWMCKKQTSVSHSSTESDIISLDTGLRLDGLLALELWDLIVSVFGNISHISDRRGQFVNVKNKSLNKIDVLQDIDSVPSNVQSANHELYCMCLKTMRLFIKMIMKGRSPTMRHVSRTHRVALDWLFDRINLDPKIQINYIDTKNQLADILTKGNFTRDEWNHLLTLLILAILALLPASQRWQNELNKNQEKDVSQPNHDIWWFWPQERLRSCLLQLHQTRGRPRMDIKILKDMFLTIERGNLWKRQDHSIYKGLWSILVFSRVERWSWRTRSIGGNLRKILGIHCKTLTLVVKNIFSAGRCILQGNEETIHDRTGQLVSENLQGKAHFENFIMGSEGNRICEWSQRPSANSTEKNVKHCRGLYRTFNNMGNVLWLQHWMHRHFYGKEFLNYPKCCEESWKSYLETDVWRHKWSTIRKKFLVWTLLYQKNSWTQLSLINDPVIISLQSTKVYVFSDSVLCLGKVLQHPECNEAWEKQSCRSTSWEELQRFWGYQRRVDGMRVEYFPRIHNVAALRWSQRSTERLGRSTRSFRRKNSFLWKCSMTSSVKVKATKNNVSRMQNLWKRLQEDLELVNGLSLDQVLRKSGILPRTVRKENGTMLRKICFWDLQKVDILSFVQRLHCPEVSWKGKGKVSIHFAADQDTVDIIYRIFVSVNQLSVNGAVAAICEEFEDHQDRTGQPVILVGQSIVSRWSRSSCSWWRSQKRPNHSAAIHSKSWIIFTRKQIG